jgi:hypothetical protein
LRYVQGCAAARRPGLSCCLIGRYAEISGEGIRDEYLPPQGLPIMTSQNHYEVLGVSSEADATQIRTAYVHLLKRYHPDWAHVSDGQQNADQLQRVVAAYKILKNPASRAKYDAALRRLASRPARLRPAALSSAEMLLFKQNARPTAAVRSRTPFKLDPDSASYVLMFIAAVAGLYLLATAFVGPTRASLGSAAGTGSPARNVPTITQFEPVVRRAGMMSSVDASNYSWRCFAAAGRSRDPVAADPCVGFDAAYVYWREAIAGVLVTDPYFQPDAMRSRAEDAFGRVGPIEASVRVESIRAATFQALMLVSTAPHEISTGFSKENEARATTARPPTADRAAIFAIRTKGNRLADGP